MIGIVILNYNTWDETINLLDSLNKYYKNMKYKCYVVDNCSDIKPNKDQEEYFKSKNNIELIFSKFNKGYSAGNNIGIKRAIQEQCNYIFICNSDVLFIDKTIINMIHFSQANPNVGIVGPQIFDSKGIFQPFYMLTKLTALGKLKLILLKTPISIFLNKFKSSFIREYELDKPLKVFGVSGCCFMMTNKCAKFLYPFDENTFLYEEEYIIGSKLEQSAYESYVIPNTHIIHAHGKSTKGITKFSYNCYINSEQYYLKAYLHTNSVLCKLIYIIRKLLYLLIYKNHSVS